MTGWSTTGPWPRPRLRGALLRGLVRVLWLAIALGLSGFAWRRPGYHPARCRDPADESVFTALKYCSSGTARPSLDPEPGLVDLPRPCRSPRATRRSSLPAHDARARRPAARCLGLRARGAHLVLSRLRKVGSPLDVLAGAALGVGIAIALRMLPAALRRSPRGRCGKADPDPDPRPAKKNSSGIEIARTSTKMVERAPRVMHDQALRHGGGGGRTPTGGAPRRGSRAGRSPGRAFPGPLAGVPAEHADGDALALARVPAGERGEREHEAGDPRRTLAQAPERGHAAPRRGTQVPGGLPARLLHRVRRFHGREYGHIRGESHAGTHCHDRGSESACRSNRGASAVPRSARTVFRPSSRRAAGHSGSSVVPSAATA